MPRSLALTAVCLFAAGSASAQNLDSYVRYELLAPQTARVRVTLDATISKAGATSFSDVIRVGQELTDIVATDLATGDALKVEQKVKGAVSVLLKRAVPEGGEARVRLQASYDNPSEYHSSGDALEFHRTDLPPRGAIVLPAGYEILASDMPVQVLEQADGRIVASFMQTRRFSMYIRARRMTGRPAPSVAPSTPPPTPPIADAPPRELPMNQIRVAERAIQDRTIVYFLKEPETHAFALYHDYTAAREGEHQYVNVVRAGSTVSDPSAKNLDTGEALKTRTLTGADIAREKIDIPDRVEPHTQVVLIPFPPVKKGTSVRLRISETYTDPARYALVDGQLMWHRSFGRPRNDMVLPAGWYLTTSSIPAAITQESDGRIRLSFWNPRPDTLDVLVRARRR